VRLFFQRTHVPGILERVGVFLKAIILQIMMKCMNMTT
jgi:hypothetical protein